MRIIAGQAKGVKLKTPPGTTTRPITAMIREALFNILAAGVNEAAFLDLFAGSGSVGIEALSRGAGEAVFVDRSPRAAKTIHENLARSRLTQRATVLRMDIIRALHLLQKRKKKFQYIYIDPPFDNTDIGLDALKTLDHLDIFYRQAVIIIRFPKKKEITVSLEKLKHYRTDRYGESVLYYYQFAGEDH